MTRGMGRAVTCIALAALAGPAGAEQGVGARPHNRSWRCEVSGVARARFTLRSGGRVEKRISLPGQSRALVVSLGAAAPGLLDLRDDGNIVSVEAPFAPGRTLIEWREVRSPEPCSREAGVFSETHRRIGTRVRCEPASGFWSSAGPGRARCDARQEPPAPADRVSQVVAEAPTFVEVSDDPPPAR